MKAYFQECFKHFLSRLSWEQKGCSQEKRIIAKILDVDVQTIRRWFTGVNTPLGMPLIRLRYLLEMMGYTVTELEKLDPRVKKLGFMIALNIIDPDEAAKELGYIRGSNLFPLLHGKQGFLRDKEKVLEALVESREEELKSLVDMLTKNLQKEYGEELSAFGDEGNELINETIKQLKGLRSSVQGLEPLLLNLKKLASKETDPSIREAFREKASRDLVFDLSNDVYKIYQQLSALCSETALRILREKEDEQ